MERQRDGETEGWRDRGMERQRDGETEGRRAEAVWHGLHLVHRPHEDHAGPCGSEGERYVRDHVDYRQEGLAAGEFKQRLRGEARKRRQAAEESNGHAAMPKGQLMTRGWRRGTG